MSALEKEVLFVRSIPSYVWALSQELLDQTINNILRRMINERLTGRPGLIPHTGRLLGSLHRTPIVGIKTRFEAHVNIGAGLPYVNIHEFGGTIRAIYKKYLHFKTRDGLWHFAKQVKIPPRLKFKVTVREEVVLFRAKLRSQFKLAGLKRIQGFSIRSGFTPAKSSALFSPTQADMLGLFR